GPTHARRAALRGRLPMMTAQDIADRNFVESMAHVREGTLDAAVAPRRVLFRHADHELLDLLGDTRTSKLTAMWAAVELLRNEAVIPTHERIGGGNSGAFFETFATERMSHGGKAAAFGIGEAEPAPTEWSL